MSTPEVVELLVVEDNPADLALVRAYLGRSASDGVKVIDVSDAEGALVKLRNSSFDAMLIDWFLANESAEALVSSVTLSHPDIAVIVITGSDDSGIAEAALMAGADEFLSKQELSSKTLMRAIRHARVRTRARLAQAALNR